MVFFVITIVNCLSSWNFHFDLRNVIENLLGSLLISFHIILNQIVSIMKGSLCLLIWLMCRNFPVAYFTSFISYIISCLKDWLISDNVCSSDNKIKSLFKEERSKKLRSNRWHCWTINFNNASFMFRKKRLTNSEL